MSKNWPGPEVTPAWIGIDTPLGYLNDSWNIAVRLLEKGMDSHFIYLDHLLDGGELKVELNPHPQKTKGTTPLIDPRQV